MNRDIQKSFLFRLGIASLIGAIAWHILVGAKLEREQELARALALQTKSIINGEQEIEQHADELSSSIDRMRRTREEMITHLDMLQSSKAHQILQNSAESHGLIVSRVEPIRMGTDRRIRKVDQSEIKLGISEYRLECSGSFGNLVGFIGALNNGKHLAQIDSFRIIPMSNHSARMSIQVSIYQLLEAPELFFKSFKEPELGMTDAGGLEDEI